jgi:hypothetical protein
LLGCYNNFPENIHGICLLQSHNRTKILQQVILCTFHRLNNETFGLGVLTPYLKQSCEVGFEFGVANGTDFNFLEQNELSTCLIGIEKAEMDVLDFFCVVRYHLIKDHKRIPLKFDYHILRFVFREDNIELQVRHERGTRRITLNELIDFVVKQINVELFQRMLTPLHLENLEKVSVLD